MIVIEKATEPKDKLPPVLYPYFEASAQEVNDRLGAGATSIDYETYNTLYKVGQLGVYYILDADEGLLIGYCLALEHRGFLTADVYVDAISLYIIPRYRGKKEIIRKLRGALHCDYPDADYLRFELPTKMRKFNQPCCLICQVPLKV